MNIETLSGRDLDALVAAQLFGLQVEPRANARTGEQDFVCAVNPGQWVRVNEPGQGRVVLAHADGRMVEASGPVNEALCRAGLKAVAAAANTA